MKWETPISVPLLTSCIRRSLMTSLQEEMAVMNLLPLPALDGGRLLFLIIEAITGKAVSQNMEALVHTAGLILLMLLMVFVMYQDIVKIFM